MKNITMIAAIGKNNELGKKNDLIWHFSEDMRFFREQTINKPIIMGRKTLESLPKLLPKRKHIVLSRRSNDNRWSKYLQRIFRLLRKTNFNRNRCL